MRFGQEYKQFMLAAAPSLKVGAVVLLLTANALPEGIRLFDGDDVRTGRQTLYFQLGIRTAGRRIGTDSQSYFAASRR